MTVILPLLEDERSAKESLKWLARINNSNFNVDDVTLREEGTVTEKRSFLETLKDFITYPSVFFSFIYFWKLLKTS